MEGGVSPLFQSKGVYYGKNANGIKRKDIVPGDGEDGQTG